MEDARETRAPVAEGWDREANLFCSSSMVIIIFIRFPVYFDSTDCLLGGMPSPMTATAGVGFLLHRNEERCIRVFPRECCNWSYNPRFILHFTQACSLAVVWLSAGGRRLFAPTMEDEIELCCVEWTQSDEEPEWQDQLMRINPSY